MFKNNPEFYVILLYALLILLFRDSLSGNIILVLGVISWSLIIYINRKEDRSFILFRLLILSVPFSFINVFGGSYGESIISWYNIFLILFIANGLIKSIYKRDLSFSYLSLAALLLLIISSISLLQSPNFVDATKQYINISSLLILVIISFQLKGMFTEEKIKTLVYDYISGAKVAGIGVLVQFLNLNIFGTTYGFYVQYGGYRDALGFLFSDFSFLSLYISSAAMAVFFVKKSINYKYLWIVEMLFLLVVSLLTTARTGLAAFGIVFGVYSVVKFYTLLLKGSSRSLLLLSLNSVILFIGIYIINSVREGVGFSGSGRSEINDQAFETFINNPLVGIGFGSDTYGETVGVIPHNLLYQSLAQGGLIFTIPLFLFLILAIWLTFRNKKYLLPVLLCILFGALFIPNIFNSRFLAVILAICNLKANKNNVF